MVWIMGLWHNCVVISKMVCKTFKSWTRVICDFNKMVPHITLLRADILNIMCQNWTYRRNRIVDSKFNLSKINRYVLYSILINVYRYTRYSGDDFFYTLHHFYIFGIISLLSAGCLWGLKILRKCHCRFSFYSKYILP